MYVQAGPPPFLPPPGRETLEMFYVTAFLSPLLLSCLFLNRSLCVLVFLENSVLHEFFFPLSKSRRSLYDTVLIVTA